MGPFTNDVTLFKGGGGGQQKWQKVTGGEEGGIDKSDKKWRYFLVAQLARKKKDQNHNSTEP